MVSKHEKVPKTPCERLVEYFEASGEESRAGALRTLSELHDPFELKDWIEERLETIWKLDAALNHAQSEGETDMEEVAALFFWGGASLLRSEGPAKTETRLKALSPSQPQNPNPTESCGYPKSRLISQLLGVLWF